MARVQAAAEEAAEHLREWVRSLRVGTVSVREAHVRFDEDARGDLALFVDLTLADPSPGSETWPVDEVLELHRMIDDHANELGVPLPWHVTLQKESEEPEAEELEAEDG